MDLVEDVVVDRQNRPPDRQGPGDPRREQAAEHGQDEDGRRDHDQNPVRDRRGIRVVDEPAQGAPEEVVERRPDRVEMKPVRPAARLDEVLSGVPPGQVPVFPDPPEDLPLDREDRAIREPGGTGNSIEMAHRRHDGPRAPTSISWRQARRRSRPPPDPRPGTTRS